MRSIWSGAISFGLVNIPVKLLSAVDTEELKFDLLSKDMAPIRYARLNKNTGKEVPWKDIVKGFEYEEVKKGMGIKNIESRIKSMNATHKWKKTFSNKGSRLIIKIPKYHEFPNQTSTD